MNRVQVIEQDGKPAFYVVPAALWERMQNASEHAQDVADIERFDREDEGVRYPSAVAHAIADRAPALRAWREYRGMTSQALADSAGVSRPYISQIETGRRTGTLATLQRLAQALAIPVQALAPL